MRSKPIETRSETLIVEDILGYLLKLPQTELGYGGSAHSGRTFGAHARKVHGSRYQQAGEPDIDACVVGRAVKIEVKRPGEEPTPVQYASLRRWERAGALAGWAVSVDDVEELLTHVHDFDWINPAICRHDRYPQEPMSGTADIRCSRCGFVHAPPDERRL